MGKSCCANTASYRFMRYDKNELKYSAFLYFCTECYYREIGTTYPFKTWLSVGFCFSCSTNVYSGICNYWVIERFCDSPIKYISLCETCWIAHGGFEMLLDKGM